MVNYVPLDLTSVMQIIQSDPRTLVGKILAHMMDFWNFVDMVIILLVLAGLPLRLVSEDTLLHGRVCYCVAASLSYVRLFDVFSISRFLGPYVYMMAKMVSAVFVINYYLHQTEFSFTG